MGKYWLGKNHSPETKKKISDAKKGQRNSQDTEFRKGEQPPIHNSDCKCFRCGGNARELNHKWKGGKLNWAKKQTKVRDDYTCQVCGLREPEIMEADHIKPRALSPELISSLENMITLCPNCHARKTIRDKRQILESKHSLGINNKNLPLKK